MSVVSIFPTKTMFTDLKVVKCYGTVVWTLA